MRPRALTGVGVACSLGVGRQVVLDALGAGAPVAGTGGRVEVPGFDPTAYLGDKGLRSLDRLTKLLLVATRLALHDTGLKKDGAWAAGTAETVGIIVSNAYGSLEAITELDRVAILEDPRYINPARFPLTVANSHSGYASIWEEIRAVNVSVSDGNCGGLDVFACADAMLGQGRAKAILTGGAEAMSEALHLAFRKLGAARHDALLGEGAVMFGLEPVEDAKARGAEVLGEVTGYGTAFEPPESEAELVQPSGTAVERAVAAALEDAGIAAGEVDLVVSGACGVRVFDEREIVAITRVLGDVAVLAPKRGLGETLGAGGSLGVLAAVAALGGASPYPVRGTVRRPARTAVVTAMGYYGNASALVMRAGAR